MRTNEICGVIPFGKTPQFFYRFISFIGAKSKSTKGLSHFEFVCSGVRQVIPLPEHPRTCEVVWVGDLGPSRVGPLPPIYKQPVVCRCTALIFASDYRWRLLMDRFPKKNKRMPKILRRLRRQHYTFVVSPEGRLNVGLLIGLCWVEKSQRAVYGWGCL